MSDAQTKPVTCRISFLATWRDIVNPDPRSEVAKIVRQSEKVKRTRELIARDLADHGIAELLPYIDTLKREHSEPAGVSSKSRGWKWYDARFMIATALGVPEPDWNGKTNSWWMDRDRGAPLGLIGSAEELRAVSIPDWESLPQVRKMFEARARWKQVFPYDPAEFQNLNRYHEVDGKRLRSVGYPSFVDMGMFLMGTTRFFTELGLKSPIADAIMDKCLELSTSYVDFLRTCPYGPKDPEVRFLSGFAGDAACMLSPGLYDRYSASWDARLFEYVRATHSTPDDLPCNLHSCGPSSHLYERWREHPCRNNISVMQTRLIPGEVDRLRKSLPETRLELTFHPQHFDVARVTPEKFRRVLDESTEGAGGRKLHYTVFAVAHKPRDAGRILANLMILGEALEDYNRGAA